MRVPWPFRRNQRWIRQVDAYVDDRLTPIERELLEDRVDEAGDVRKELDRTWALKQELRRLPEHPAPRSFAITPAMLKASEPAPRPRAAVATMRLAQGAAFATVAAFAITVSLHASGWGATEPDYAVVPAAAAEGDAEPVGEDSFGTMSDEEAPPVDGDLQGGERLAGEEPEALPGTDEAAGLDGDADAALVLTAPAESPNFLPVYGALTVMIVLAGGAWFITWRQVPAGR